MWNSTYTKQLNLELKGIFLAIDFDQRLGNALLKKFSKNWSPEILWS